MQLIDVDPGGGRARHDLSCLDLASPGLPPQPFSLNLFHMNPPELAGLVASLPGLDVTGRLNTCVPFWELPLLRADWAEVLGWMDFVLSPTRFIRQAIERSVPSAVCIDYPQAPVVPCNVEPNRARFGVPEEATVFLVAFDLNSDPSRKNPWASIHAFDIAFPRPGNEYLVIKLNAVVDARERHAEDLARLYSMCEERPNVVLVDEILSFDEVMSLYASVDVLMSLHRSEGLGLSPMESMRLGKAVVATGWSGNMDYMTEENACLVDYDLVPVRSSVPSYAPLNGMVEWAEADIEHAAEYLVRLAGDQRYRRKVGERARQDMAEREKRYWRGLVWDRVKQLVTDSRSPVWEARRERLRSIGAIQEMG